MVMAVMLHNSHHYLCMFWCEVDEGLVVAVVYVLVQRLIRDW